VKHSVKELRPEELEVVDRLFEKNRNQLELYSELLLWWNKKINLVSRDVSRETVLEHIKHSLFISLTAAFKSGVNLIDTGAGGGLPGLPLSICFPEKTFVINDIVSKKIFAVNDMINKLQLKERTSSRAGNIKSVEIDDGVVVLTKHAFKVDQLYELIRDKSWDKIVFLKGVEEALEEASRIRDNIHVEIISLETGFMSGFYDGKGLVELSRGGNE
jgi:16S rRNA (guanine527-N7)-methyltransferase